MQLMFSDRRLRSMGWRQALQHQAWPTLCGNCPVYPPARTHALRSSPSGPESGLRGVCRACTGPSSIMMPRKMDKQCQWLRKALQCVSRKAAHVHSLISNRVILYNRSRSLVQSCAAYLSNVYFLRELGIDEQRSQIWISVVRPLDAIQKLQHHKESHRTQSKYQRTPKPHIPWRE